MKFPSNFCYALCFKFFDYGDEFWFVTQYDIANNLLCVNNVGYPHNFESLYDIEACKSLICTLCLHKSNYYHGFEDHQIDLDSFVILNKDDFKKFWNRQKFLFKPKFKM